MPTRVIAMILTIVVLFGGCTAAVVVWRAAEVGELVGVIERRVFETFTVVAVGTGGAYENPERMGPVTAFGLGENVVLVDAGRGLSPALRLARIPVNQPLTVLLTSLWPENVFGLADFLFTGQLEEREGPITVVGPVGTKALVSNLEALYAQGGEAQQTALALAPEAREIEVIEAGEGWTMESSGLEIRAAELPGGPIPALAYRINAGRDSVVINGVGWGREELIAFSKGADMLVTESAYIPPTEDLEDAGVVADPARLAAETALHIPMLEVGELATKAGVNSLVLTRLRPPPFFALQVQLIVGKSFDGRVLVPEDGDEY